MRRFVIWMAAAVALSFALTSIAEAQGTPTSGNGKVRPLCASGCITYGVSVTPDNSPSTQPVSTNGLSYGFTVTNTGSSNESDTYTVSCSATGPMVCDSLVSSGGPLAPIMGGASVQPQCFHCGGGGSTTLTLTLTGGTSSGVMAWAHTTAATGSAVLTVSAVGGRASDGGSYDVAVVAPSAPVAVLINNNPTEIARDLCVTSGAGAAAGVSCGDLFVAHGMPAYRTMGRDRSLSLEYNSATATGLLLVPIAVTEPAGTLTPTSVRVVLQVGGKKDSATFSPIATGTTQQLVLGRGLDTLSTGVYAESLAVTNVYGASFLTTTVAGQVLVVNRSVSPFGRGWALDGVEQLIVPPTGTGRFWVDGDGSARLYSQLNSTTWVAPLGAFQDTIVKADSFTYVRYLRHGVRVVFNNAGQHLRTVNRLGDSTTFAYSTVAGQSRLTSIAVPPNAGAARMYRFFYNSSTATLDSILDPGDRRLKTVLTSGQLTSITDPDNTVTSFEYSSTHHRMTRQVFSRPELGSGVAFGNVYVYGHNSRVTQVKVPAGLAGADTMVTTLTPWDEQGLASGLGATGQAGAAYPSGGIATLIDGPIAGTGDRVQVWVNAFGQPTKSVLTGTGATTTIAYGDAQHPVLPTQVTSPTNVVTRMHYNGRGNLDTLWQGSPDSLIGLPNRRQTWAYTDGNTPDGPTQVKDPLGRTTTYAYTSLGLTDSVIDARGHHTDFGYIASGAFKGLVDSVVERQVTMWQQSDSTTPVLDLRTVFTYDNSGNVITSTSPVGVVTSYVNDSLGRTTDVYDPLGGRSSRFYDVMNRMFEATRYTVAQDNPYGIQPLANCVATQMSCSSTSVPSLTTTPDSVGGGYSGGGDTQLPTTLSSQFRYGGVGVDSVIDPGNVLRAYVHAANGATRQEIDDYGQAATTYSGASGLVDSTRSRSGVVVHFGYDSIGRNVWMAYPARIWAARDAFPSHTTPGDSLTYTYDSYGRLTEQRSVALSNGRIDYSYYADGSLRSKAITLPDPDTLLYRYDSTGVRASLYHVTVNGPVSRDSTRYFYGHATGTLDSLAVWWLTPSVGRQVVGFQWDELGRRAEVTYPSAHATIRMFYDATGLLRRLLSTTTVAPPNGNSLHVEVTQRLADPLGRVTLTGVQCDGPTNAAAYACAGWPSLTTTNTYNTINALAYQVNQATHDTLRYNASGSIVYRSSSADGANVYLYPTGHNRDSTISHPQTDGGTVVTTVSYTADGDRLSEDTQGPSGLNHGSSRYYYYDGLGRMSGLSSYTWDATFLKYDPYDSDWNRCEYGPDGRLVRACGDGASVIYDGSNVVGTDLDTWHFVQGPGTDDPLIGMSVAPGGAIEEIFYVTDGQGRQYAVADSTGYLDPNIFTSGALTSWRGWQQAGGIQNASSFGADRNGNSDTPQLSFFRNRVYDQRSGQWTQEDPSGIAGGVNLYEYAGNDPVRYTDPFGLCPSDVGGDGKTASVDDCAQGVKDAWASKHIRNTSSNNTDITGVDHDLMDAVVRTSMQHRMDLGISAGREGGHSEAGHHADGRAVDINQLGDIRFKDMPASERVRLGNMIGAEIVNRLPESRTLMLFAPGMAFNTQSPRNLRQTEGLMAAHWNHIHITVTAP